jgi:hypothetical protein
MRLTDAFYLADGIPEHMLESLVEYRDNHRPVGDFLRAVLSNNLMEAAGRADNVNIYLLHKYARFLYNEMPMAACGSVENYEAWISGAANDKN